jgi:hypothetical protein
LPKSLESGLGRAKPTDADASERKPRAAFTIKEFCEAHRLSEAMYYKIRTAGLGPREMRTFRKITISIEAAEQWRRERELTKQLPAVQTAA